MVMVRRLDVRILQLLITNGMIGIPRVRTALLQATLWSSLVLLGPISQAAMVIP